LPERYLGTTLGRFRIEAVVGSGGFAWVFRGYDPELEIPVAVKVLKPQFAGDETFETRFRREAAMAARLRHPNIIRILGVGRDRDAVYFAMDYLPHGLVERIGTLGTLPEPMLIRLGLDVSSALAFAHREGVIHRDIKIDNVLFDEHGNAVVADFGIARAVSGYVEQTGTNMVVGTPQYFSPEQARGQPLDGRADIYSLGVTLFKAATGSLPFEGDDWYEIARQHVEDEPPRPRSLNPALSRETERVILTCLEKDPSHRYANGESLCATLAELLSKIGEPSGSRTLMLPGFGANGSAVIRTGRTWGRRAARRLAKRSAALTAVAGALVVALIIGTTRERSSAAPRQQLPSPADTASMPATESQPPALPADTVDTTSLPAAEDSVPRPDTAPPATSPGQFAGPVTRRELRVTAPADARILLDGEVVGRGDWSSTKISPGAHMVKAVLESSPDCRWARDSASVRVRRSGVFPVTLDPRPCGYLTLDYSEPEGAEYTVSSTTDSTMRLSGSLPAPEPITLPTGTYRVEVLARLCALFTSEFEIVADVTWNERVRLLCER
jgi:eukaryotic-like serine/threonine-protein kinase